MRSILVLVLIFFTGFTIFTIATESFFPACSEIWAFQWGKQLTVDLYIGLLLFVYIIYLFEKSVLKTVAWLVPTLILGNLIPLLYLVLNYKRVIKTFQ